MLRLSLSPPSRTPHSACTHVLVGSVLNFITVCLSLCTRTWDIRTRAPPVFRSALIVAARTHPFHLSHLALSPSPTYSSSTYVHVCTSSTDDRAFFSLLFSSVFLSFSVYDHPTSISCSPPFSIVLSFSLFYYTFQPCTFSSSSMRPFRSIRLCFSYPRRYSGVEEATRYRRGMLNTEPAFR